MTRLEICDKHFVALSYIAEGHYKTECPACTAEEENDELRKEIESLKSELQTKIEELDNASITD